MAEHAKRDVASVEPRLEKALTAHGGVTKAMNEVTNLETNMRIENEKTLNHLEMMET